MPASSGLGLTSVQGPAPCPVPDPAVRLTQGSHLAPSLQPRSGDPGAGLSQPSRRPPASKRGKERRASVCPEGSPGPGPRCEGVGHPVGQPAPHGWGEWAQRRERRGSRLGRDERIEALVRPSAALGGAARPTHGLGTMHPSRRSLPFPLNCQLVRVGTADYGGLSDQVSQLHPRCLFWEGRQVQSWRLQEPGLPALEPATSYPLGKFL